MHPSRLIPLLLAAGILAAGFFYATQSAQLGERLCDFRDGRWGSAARECILPNCAQDNSCGHWVAPASRCQYVTVGDPLSRVYFQLGQPDYADGKQSAWFASKDNKALITATFENGRLEHFSCPALHTQ